MREAERFGSARHEQVLRPRDVAFGVAYAESLLEGRLALAAHVAGADTPAYFILLEAGRVTSIRDFRYVPYIAAEAEFEPA